MQHVDACQQPHLFSLIVWFQFVLPVQFAFLSCHISWHLSGDLGPFAVHRKLTRSKCGWFLTYARNVERNYAAIFYDFYYPS